MNTYLNPYSLQGFAEAASGTVVTKQGTDLVFQSSGSVQSDYTQMDSTAPDYIKDAPIVRVYRNVTGTSATTSPSTHAKWDVTDSSITSYTDGMVVCVKVPVSGHYNGTGFQINSLGYKPVVVDLNTSISTRYMVGSVVWAVYNSTQTAYIITNGSSVSVTGCWQIMDKDTVSEDINGIYIRETTVLRNASDIIYPWRILFSSADNTLWVPATTTTSTDYSTVKNVNQRPINPFGRIVMNSSNYYSQGTAITESAWSQNTTLLGYSFNVSGGDANLQLGDTVYVKCGPQTNGSAIIDQTCPYVTTLPSSADGYIYIELGSRGQNDNYIQLHLNHPVYYHDGTCIRLWTGSSSSGVNLIDLT